jgi:hypothetical protein
MTDQLQLPGINPVYRLKIERDDDPQNPREWDHPGTMVCWHNRYTLGDEQPKQDPGEYREGLPPRVELPLYLYDHSGITMSTGSFSCPWDSGQVGFIYVPIAKIKAEYGWKVLTKARRKKIEEYLRSEVRTYDDYLTGSVYGYTVEKLVGAICEWEQVDSCWGFYGDDPVESGLCYTIPHFSKEQIERAMAYTGSWIYTEPTGEEA